MGYAPVPMATLEINVIVVITITLGFLFVNLVNVIQLGLLTKTVMLMGDALVPISTLETNVMHAQMDTVRTFLEHVLNVRIFEERIITSSQYISISPLTFWRPFEAQ